MPTDTSAGETACREGISNACGGMSDFDGACAADFADALIEDPRQVIDDGACSRSKGTGGERADGPDLAAHPVTAPQVRRGGIPSLGEYLMNEVEAYVA